MSSKTLTIQNDKCILTPSRFGVSIDGVDIQRLIAEKMPNLEEYKNYVGDIFITIKVYDQSCNQIETLGYSLEEKIKSFKVDEEIAAELIAADSKDGGIE